jgi:hypothetical protein
MSTEKNLNIFFEHLKKKSSIINSQIRIEKVFFLIEKESCTMGAGIKYLANTNAGFKEYLSCHHGSKKVTKCPTGAAFWFVIQCCVPVSKFPCKSNCLQDHRHDDNAVKKSILQDDFAAPNADRTAVQDYFHSSESTENHRDYTYFNY